MNISRLSNAARMGMIILFTLATFCGNAQCPTVTIHEKYLRPTNQRPVNWRLNGWDTVVNCLHSSLTLHADTFITAQHFNGHYRVEQINYNPVDTTFHQGQSLPISVDDDWDNNSISFPFDFVFFGYTYTRAVVGANGLVSFNTGEGGVKSGTAAPTGLANVVGGHCAYNYNSPIPNTSFVSSPDNSYNAIYGVYEDIDPAYRQNAQSGIFKSIGGEYPCRYLCASFNGIDLFGNHNHYNTYQIVCYEGTNIIEVHVKRRQCCSSTNNGKGTIGIMNTTGQPQESHYHNQDGRLNDLPHPPSWYPSHYIEPNSPGAFVAPGRNGWNGEIQYEAWRFTPLGDETAMNLSWWRLIEDGHGNIIDSVEFTTDPGDTNGVYLDTRYHLDVSVSPTRPTRYLVKCRYQGANGYWYGMDGISMHDTISIGIDTAKQMSLENPVTHETGVIRICDGQQASVTLLHPNTQVLDSCVWSSVKILRGQRTVMPASTRNDNFRTTTLLRQNNLEPNKIDSVWVYCTTKFGNGCNNNDSILILTYPKFILHDTVYICQGDSYRWNNHDYNETGIFNKVFQSAAGCDSTRYLHLYVDTISHTTDYVLDCKAHTWINGKTYTADNDATRWMDTVVLLNRAGCDSIVKLDFTFIPMEAIINHTPEVATLDELTIELTDASYGHDSRLWLLPDGSTTKNAVTYINFPLNGIDSMTVRLAVHNNYGCDDTAKVVVPLHKVSRYVPNAFTPERSENNRFQPMLQGNISDLQCWIYNRHGELIYSFTGPDGYWDGTTKNGQRCPQGTYVYVLRYRTSLEPNTTLEIPGTITLIR